MTDKTNNLDEMNFLDKLETQIYKVYMIIEDITYSHMRYKENSSEENLLKAFKETFIRVDMIDDYINSMQEIIDERKQAINEQMSEAAEETGNDGKGNLH